jgi:zinc/manganese transport system substrate-binding protein
MNLGRLVLCAMALLFWPLPASADKPKVVATFSIVGDMVARVGGSEIELTTLVGPDADAHVFEPTPAHARALADAQIVFANGLDFEPWLPRLMKSTDSRARVAVVSARVKPLAFHRARDRHGHEDEAADPHAWQDIRNAVTYVDNIAQALCLADRANAAAYKANAAAYVSELLALDVAVRASFVRIPKASRRVITNHRAFGYFAKAYDVEFIAPLGTSTEEQASAKGVARLITQIRRERITAVFVENITDPRLIQQIARETGVKIGGRLYSDALSTNAGPAPTYLAMMRHNVKLLTAAMAPAH